MASIELSPILDHLGEGDVDALESALADAGASPLDVDEDAESVFLDADLEDDLLAEIIDRLEVHDAACDIYVPPDFEEVFEIGGNRIGSAHMLLLVLQEMKEELFVDDDEDDDLSDIDEDYNYADSDETLDGDADAEEPYALKEKQLRHIWRLMYAGARACIKHGVCMFVRQ
jgi:hypothetical protein